MKREHFQLIPKVELDEDPLSFLRNHNAQLYIPSDIYDALICVYRISRHDNPLVNWKKMNKHMFNHHLVNIFKKTLLACPLLAVMAISGNVLCTDLESDKATSISLEEAEMQAEREMGRLWLIALPHLASEEKDIVTQYLQAGIRRDYDKTQQVVEKINAMDLVECQARQQLLDIIVKYKKETK